MSRWVGHRVWSTLSILPFSLPAFQLSSLSFLLCTLQTFLSHVHKGLFGYIITTRLERMGFGSASLSRFPQFATLSVHNNIHHYLRHIYDQPGCSSRLTGPSEVEGVYCMCRPVSSFSDATTAGCSSYETCGRGNPPLGFVPSPLSELEGFYMVLLTAVQPLQIRQVYRCRGVLCRRDKQKIFFYLKKKIPLAGWRLHFSGRAD